MVCRLKALKHVETAFLEISRQPKCQARKIFDLHELTIDLDEVHVVLIIFIIRKLDLKWTFCLGQAARFIEDEVCEGLGHTDLNQTIADRLRLKLIFLVLYFYCALSRVS